MFQDARSVISRALVPSSRAVFQESLHQSTSYLLQGSVKSDIELALGFLLRIPERRMSLACSCGTCLRRGA